MRNCHLKPLHRLDQRLVSVQWIKRNMINKEKRNSSDRIASFYQNPYFDDKLCRLTKGNSSRMAWQGTTSNNDFNFLPLYCIMKVDIDNFIKLLFDIFKGYVYKDDSQILYVLCDMNIHPSNMIGFFAGVRELRDEESPDDYWPALSSSNLEAWREERLKKFGQRH